MNDLLHALQCLDKIANAAHVINPKKQQKLNAVPMSNGSHTVVLVMMSLSLNLYPFTVANACQQTGNRLVAL